jgi:hypothetical protein
MNNLEASGQKLTTAGKENPFKVPDGYFDTLPTRVQNFCKEHSTENQPVHWVFAVRSQLALAAGFCVLVLLAFAGYYYSQQANDVNAFEKVDYIKIVEESGTEFDEIQLYEAATGNHKKDITVKNSMNDELTEYLLYDNIFTGSHLEHPKDIKP